MRTPAASLGADRRARLLAACALVVTGGALLRWAYGPGYVGYDASWTLVWGSDLAHGRLPSYGDPVAPTPHPLAILIAVVLTALGHDGSALVVLEFIAFAALLAGLLVLGARLVWWPAGVLAAAIVGTRGVVIDDVGFASIDIPFMACVVWAAVLEAGRPRCGLPVLALLLVAGLLRPEAWLLSVVYVFWIAPVSSRAQLAGAVALAVAAPALWALADLAVTGDALHSVRQTQDLTRDLRRPTGLGHAVNALPEGLRRVLGDLPLLAAMLGGAAGLALAPRRVLLPAAVVATSVLGWFLIGSARLPLLIRFLLLPACMLALLAGLGAALARVAPGRIVAYAAAGGVLLLLVASVPATIDDIAAARRSVAPRERSHRDLQRLAGTRAVRAAVRRCARVAVPDVRTRPLLIFYLGVDRRRVDVGAGPTGLVLTYGSREAARAFRFPGHAQVRRPEVRPDATVVARNGSWLAYADCGRTE